MTAARSRKSADDAFRARLDACRLLKVMNKIYRKEYGLSAKKYLAHLAPRHEAELMLKTLESAPRSITRMFRRRLNGKCKKNDWTPMIPIPAIKRNRDTQYFVEEGSSSSAAFHADFQRLAGAGQLLYTTMKPSDFLKYAYGGEIIEERAEDKAPGTAGNVKRKEKRIGRCIPLDTPFLKLDLATCRFVLHDGRHRVVAAYERGVKAVPVLIEHGIPANEKERQCLRARSLWKIEDVSSPTLRRGEEV